MPKYDTTFPLQEDKQMSGLKTRDCTLIYPFLKTFTAFTGKASL